MTDLESGVHAAKGIMGNGKAGSIDFDHCNAPIGDAAHLLHLGHRKRSTRVRTIPTEERAVNTMILTYQGDRYYLVIGDQGGFGLVDDESVVQILGESMKQGIDTVVANSRYIFTGNLDEVTVSSMFSNAEQLYVEDQLVYWAAATDSLLEEIADAGVALLAWFA